MCSIESSEVLKVVCMKILFPCLVTLYNKGTRHKSCLTDDDLLQELMQDV